MPPGTTPKLMTSASESISAPIRAAAFIMRATRPSRASRTAAATTSASARSMWPFSGPQCGQACADREDGDRRRHEDPPAAACLAARPPRVRCDASRCRGAVMPDPRRRRRDACPGSRGMAGSAVGVVPAPRTSAGHVSCLGRRGRCGAPELAVGVVHGSVITRFRRLWLADVPRARSRPGNRRRRGSRTGSVRRCRRPAACRRVSVSHTMRRAMSPDLDDREFGTVVVRNRGRCVHCRSWPRADRPTGIYRACASRR